MPGPTKSEFASVSGMDKTELFKSATSARKVAEDGYNGILKGKMNVVSGMSIPQRMMLSMISILPKKMVLRQIRRMQEV